MIMKTIKLLLILFSGCVMATPPNPPNNTGLLKQNFEWAHITNGGTCAVSSQGGSLVSATALNGTGICDTTFTAGVFSAAPACWCTADSASSYRLCQISTTATTSGVSTATAVHDGTAANANIYLFCAGAR